MGYLITIFLLLIVIELIYIKIAAKFHIVDKPNARSSHFYPTLRGGGIIFAIGVYLFVAFYGIHYPWFLVGLTGISIISFIDDVKNIHVNVRLMIQFLSIVLLFVDLGVFHLYSLWSILIVLTICVGIVNAFNFMDGINGMTGNYSLAVLIPLIYLNLKNAFVNTNFLIILVLSVLVFNFFNFRKKAICFAGDAGAVAIAFIFLFLFGKLILHTGKFYYIFFLVVYGTDTVLTIIHRIMLHENLYSPHRKHLFQILVNELNVSHLVVSSIYMFIQLCISFGLIFIPSHQWVYCGTVLLCLSFVYLVLMKKYYPLHEEYIKNEMKNM